VLLDLSLCRFANQAWLWANARACRRFEYALKWPQETQKARLFHLLKNNADSAFGKAFGFSKIHSIDDFQKQVPLSTYTDYEPWIQRILAGEEKVLTREAVTRCVPSSGSTSARKLIPYTAALQREFNAAIGPWIADMYRARPNLKSGPAYWSVSPAIPETGEATQVPIGFDDDADYLGFAKHLVNATLAVPSSIRFVDDIQRFRTLTLLFLLRARELRLISIWHPSFLDLMLNDLSLHWDQLLRDISTGARLTPAERAFESLGRADPRRSKQLAALSPDQTEKIWPRLGVISCWGDGPAQGSQQALATRFPGATVLSKGLIATEAFVSLPFRNKHPLAINGHFFEFIDDEGRVLTAESLQEGGCYSVAVTTGGGFYRYCLGDRIRVDDFLARTPTIRFLGKQDHVSDRFGEKLNAGFVSGILDELMASLGIQPKFVMLAPEKQVEGEGYVLYLETRVQPPADLCLRLETRLSDNPHYRYCLQLGQLKPLRLFRIEGQGNERFLDYYLAQGRRLGEIKPAILSKHTGWSARFPGNYVGCISESGQSEKPMDIRISSYGNPRHGD